MPRYYTLNRLAGCSSWAEGQCLLPKSAPRLVLREGKRGANQWGLWGHWFRDDQLTEALGRMIFKIYQPNLRSTWGALTGRDLFDPGEVLLVDYVRRTIRWDLPTRALPKEQIVELTEDPIGCQSHWYRTYHWPGIDKSDIERFENWLYTKITIPLPRKKAADLA